MEGNRNFDRQYRIKIGHAGETGFEIGAVSESQPHPLHIEFSCEKSDAEAQNTGRVTIWNLSPQHIAVLEEKDCILSLRAGYGDRLAQIFTGIVSYVKTDPDGADKRTQIEVVDNLVQVRDTYVSISYAGVVNWKTIIDAIGAQMGVAISYSYNASFPNTTNGYSYIGPASGALTAACTCCGLVWNIQNGVLQIKRPNDIMSQEVFVISPDTGLLGSPSRVSLEKSKSANVSYADKQFGWEVQYLMNGAIGVDDYVRLESKNVTGYFRAQKVEYSGDNLSGDWICKARLLEVAVSET